MSVYKIIRLFVIVCFLSACTTQTTVTIAPANAPTASTNTPAHNSSYPAPSAFTNQNEGYPAPTAIEYEDPIPTVDPSKGMVKGALQLNGEPAKGALLFLADVVKDSSGKDGLVSIDYNTPNRAMTKENGDFTFYNVPSERYVLVIVVIPNSFLLMTPGTQDPIFVDVRASQEVDLGTLNYDSLPFRDAE